MSDNSRRSRSQTEGAKAPRGRKKKLKKFMKRKLALGFALVALALFVLAVNLIRINRSKGGEYSRTVLGHQNYSSSTVPFKRGTITDRNQTVLAASEQVFRLILDPSVTNADKDEKQVRKNIEATAEAVSQVFGCSSETVAALLSDNKTSAYVPFQPTEEKYLTMDQKLAFEAYCDEYAETIAQKKKDDAAERNRKREEGIEGAEEKIYYGAIQGVWFETKYRRVYPYGAFASQVLGFSGSDSSQGHYGVEEYYNDYLTGTNGRSYGFLNQEGELERTTRDAEDGNTIVTTIDYTIQRIVENALLEFCAEKKQDYVMALVMDPKNAEVLAVAQNRTFDPNDPSNMDYAYSEAEQEALEAGDANTKLRAINSMWRCLAVTESFEPGSTAKSFTMSAALEEGLVKTDELFVCDGGQQVADRYIKCTHEHGSLNLSEALAYSCNDVMMQLAKKMGKTVFNKYLTVFGLGNRTGIDLPEESRGILFSESKMTNVDLAVTSFGQNYNATLIQIAAAYCSILNGGSYYRPHIVKQILSADGEIVREFGNTLVRETVSESTAEILKAGLLQTVQDNAGTGKNARIQGYTVAGKTGTAEQHPLTDNKYVLSFIAYTPADNPELLVFVAMKYERDLDHPGGSYNVKDTVVPLEQKIMSSLLEYRNVTPAMILTADGTEVPATPETDESGHIAGAIEPIAANRDVEWDEAVPAGGFVEGGDVPMPEDNEDAVEYLDPEELEEEGMDDEDI